MRYLIIVRLLWITVFILLVHRWGYRAGVADGRLSVYQEFASDGTEGTKYVK